MLINKLRQIGQAYEAILPGMVYHYTSPLDKIPKVVWAEDSESSGSLRLNLHEREQAIHGTTDYFTQSEYDSNIDAIQTVNANVFTNWRLNSVQYEDDTNLIHYEWEWVVTADE